MPAVAQRYGMDDIYAREYGPAFLTGIQALVRLPLMQRRLDRVAGLDTAGLISGYRGSPLGGYDQQLWKAASFLAAEDIVFQPGLNEDLAATALWGAQIHSAFGPTKYDGVFGIWYGKGPGVDRTGDAFRNSNMIGTSKHGGVLAVAGDDHAAQSSMFPHQTDGIFQSVMMPVLQPAGVSEILSLGLAGLALSRFSGLWVAMKTIAEVVESAASFTLPDPYPKFVHPSDFDMPSHGLNWDPRIQWPAQRAELERRLVMERLPAALAWARANGLDRIVATGPRNRLGIVTVGKAHQDLMQALHNLGLSPDDLSGLGVAIYKVAMSWPLETHGLLAFAGGLEEILVVEEKRPIVEGQIKEALFHQATGSRPRVVGKIAEDGSPLLPTISEFTPLMVAQAVVARLKRLGAASDLEARLAKLGAITGPVQIIPFPSRKPFFCAGCPHNTSTKLPDGSVAGGGIGCHVMALSQPERKTTTFCQMGGEGLQWVGAAPFSAVPHIFQNLGDGTYQHSGILAVRAAIAAKTNITFKILYNDAVAMTGGQAAEGLIDPARITRQLAAEGVGKIVLVSDQPERWKTSAQIASGTDIRHRDDLEAVQTELRGVSGVTAIIYEQTCAAEKRRRRKRKEAAEPDKRLFINPRVCEGCGDCSVQSNCIAIEPLMTEYGPKRRVNQSACNKDFSCVKGFCPSFVELDGPAIRKPAIANFAQIEAERFPALPSPPALSLSTGPYNIQIAGIGGMGVLTIGAILGVAAHIEGKAASVLDFTGLAQKNGAVVSQVQIAATPEDIRAVRIGSGAADLLLGTDLVVSAASDVIGKLAPGRSAIVLNIDETPTADSVTDRDATLPMRAMITAVTGHTATGRTFTVHALRLAQSLFGDVVSANMLMVGYAWQKGLIPLSDGAILASIEANGAAVALNQRAFHWGRLAAVDLPAAEHAAGLMAEAESLNETLDELIVARMADLTHYQNAAYAARYRRLVEVARTAESRAGLPDGALSRAVAVNFHKLMAYKDEFEVARLYADPAFRTALSAQFSSLRRLSVWLSPPLLASIDATTGRPRKIKFGPWIFTLFALLARLKGLRGTPFDVFGYTTERRIERRLIADYETLIRELTDTLSSANHTFAVALAAIPDQIRGFGPIKLRAIAAAKELESKLLSDFRNRSQMETAA
jgi:indolepyruvate ferredoxin oxidoreductase